MRLYNIKLETSLDYFLFFIIFIKVIFVISSIGHFILSKSTNAKAEKIDPKFLYWKQRTEFIFSISMAILLIYHFNPYFSKKPIDQETSLLFFLFGIILLLTSNWGIFIEEAPWYKDIVSILK
jgi:hypothetical protein